jgi:deoxyribodipyrimidine photo-lyase
VLRDLIRETNAQAVFWSRRYEPSFISRDTNIKEALSHEGLQVQSFNSALLFEPWEIKTNAGGPFQVFTPFWKACLHREEPAAPLPEPLDLAAPSVWPRSDKLESLDLLPNKDWVSGLKSSWVPGESEGRRRLSAFVESAIVNYHTRRDAMGESGVSRLSPHLHFGEVSPNQIWDLVSRRNASSPGLGPDTYLKELGWREFAHHLLFHFPQTVTHPLRAEFENFPWKRRPEAMKAWTRGRTGYPLVDAGMRELWHTGWMHNRVRMIAASFLVKDLLIDWREGAAWFWDTLVDADLASNTLGWQWTAGCGADAAPFFRIFNPILQEKKFDPEGVYVKRWLPERVQGPITAPIVDHAQAREQALAALSQISKKGKMDL